MNIALCADEKYAFPCGVCVTSILENNKNEECNIYILTEGLKHETIEKFQNLGNIYNQKVTIINIDSDQFKGLKVSSRFPRSIYFRFMLPRLIHNEAKVLYFDCDIIVTNKLKELWDSDITNYACGVVEDQRSDDIRVQNNLGLYKTYFNSGVLLMNLEYWRKNNTASRLTEYIYNNADKCVFPDQDALNYILCDEVLYLEYRYNYQELMMQKKEECFLHKSKWHNLLEDGELPTIIHYNGWVKPWVLTCEHKLKEEWLKYKNISPWKNTKLTPRYSLIQKLMLMRRFCLNILANKSHPGA